MARKKIQKKQKIQSFKIENDVWSYVVFVRIGGSEEQAAKAVDKQFQSDFSTDESYRSSAAPSGRSYLLNGEKSHSLWFRETPGIGLLTHEAFHSVFHVLDLSGVALNAHTEEVFAYLLDWTVKEIGVRIW